MRDILSWALLSLALLVVSGGLLPAASAAPAVTTFEAGQEPTLEIHDVGGTGNQDCLKLSGVDDYYVLDSEFARCGGGISGSGVDHVGCHGGLLVGKTFREMSGNAVINNLF